MTTPEHLKTLLQAHARRARERNSIRDEPAEITQEALVQMHIAEALNDLLFIALCFSIRAGMFKDE